MANIAKTDAKKTAAIVDARQSRFFDPVYDATTLNNKPTNQRTHQRSS
jgi:hypothetical protein